MSEIHPMACADLLDLSPQELAQRVEAWGERPFRARQVLEWVYRRGEREFARMTNLSQAFRERLAKELCVGAGTVETVSRTSDGETAKYLFHFTDGARVEAVSMKEEGHHTLCLSSQVGCAMGCAFCATGALGFTRDLTAGEILLQPFEVQRQEGKITNIVFMGMGEPLLNLANVLRAIEALTDTARFAFGTRKVTVSTCGIVPGIEALAHSPIPVRLALSLNSPFQQQRETLMPVTRGHPLPRVIAACEEFAQRTGRRVLLEYVLLKGVNTDHAAAREVARIARRLEGKVNLIEYNPVAGIPFASPDSRESRQFKSWLEAEGIEVTIRFRRGREIAAGCGQLALRNARAGDA